MFEQILKELKTKYKDLGLSETILKVVAEREASTVNTEEEIAAVVTKVGAELKIYQSFADQNRTLQNEIKDLKKGKDGAANPEHPANPNPEPSKGGEEKTDPVLALLQEMKLEIAGIKTEKINQSNAEKLTSKLKELGVNENFYGLMIDGKTFENDEQILEFAQSVKEKENAYIQSSNDDKLKDTAKTPSGGKAQVEGEVSQDVQDYIKTKFKTNEAN